MVSRAFFQFIRSGQRIVSGGGEVRHNLILDAGNQTALIVSGAGAYHHNIFAHERRNANGYSNAQPSGGASPSIAVKFTADTGTTFYNNTVDAREVTARVFSIAKGGVIGSMRSNVFYGMNTSDFGSTFAAITRAVSGDPAPANPYARLQYADYNAFWFNPLSPAKNNYDVGVVGFTATDERTVPGFAYHDLPVGGAVDAQVDPQFRGPIPNGFPFNEADIVSGTVKVSDILAYYRYVYSPAPGSPLIDAGDPADGAGTDIGAIEFDSVVPLTLTNRAPVPDAGLDKMVVTPNQSAYPFPLTTKLAYLDGNFTDDGLPSGSVTFQWSKVSGPGTVTFTNRNHPGYVSALFSDFGVYVLRLTVNDGLLESGDEVTVTVVDANLSPTPEPAPPTRLSGWPFGLLSEGTRSATLSLVTDAALRRGHGAVGGRRAEREEGELNGSL